MIKFLRPALIVLLMLCQNFSMAATADYLPADLRSRVDQLKADLDNIPTTPTNVRARAKLTWEWLNAYAINGGYSPVNASQVIATILSGEPVGAGGIKALNEAINELALADSQPDALGVLTADSGPFVAGSQATIRQTYTVGALDIQTGGGFMVARHFMPDFGPWQNTDPDGENYISISTSNPRVGFVASTAPLSGMHGGFRASRPTMVFEVASGTLQENDIVTITYGDTSDGGAGFTIPTFSSDRMPLPLYVSFADRSQFFSLPIQAIHVTGSELNGVAGFVPSVVSPDEPFTIAIRARDRFFNRATSDIPDWQVKINGKPWLNIKSTGAITLTDTSIAEPGTYFITIASTDGSIQGEANPILVSANDRDRIYWGDTHGHSGFAEGVGTPERFMQWARDDARLDYVTHSEHDIWLDDAEWERLRDNVRAFSKDGEFVAYLGYEWTVNTTRGGHHNVLFRNPDNRNRIPAQFYPTLSELYQGLRTTADTDDIVVIPHAHQAGDYRQSDPKLEPLIEVMSQHGNFEWFGRKYLEHGHQVGFTAASDNHLSQPGYSAPQGGSLSQRGGLGAVLAPEKTNDAIFDGMKARKAYATTGERMILDFEVNGVGMGQRGEFAKQREISGRIIGTSPIDRVTLFRNDQEIWTKAYIDDTEDELNRTDTFLLTFASASNPFNPHDNPRGWRGWEGTLEIHSATLESIEPVDASFPLQSVEVSAENSNRVTFATKTRGDTSSYKVRLSNIQRNTRLKFDLLETRETGGAPPFYRPAQRIPADSFSLNVREIANGSISHKQTTDSYIDQTTLRRIVEKGSREVDFTFTDTGNKQGDYYFIRVVQANDAIAWSSPVWIGGHSEK